MWKIVGLLGGLLTVNSLWAHGPGKPLALTTSWCNASSDNGSDMRLYKLSKVKTGDDHPLCLTIRNDEPIALAITLTVVPGQLDERGRKLCRVPRLPERGGAWLLEGGADGRYQIQIPAHDHRQHSFTLRIQTVSSGVPETPPHATITDWVGCLLVEGRAAVPEQADGHKGARQLQMMQADLATDEPPH
ncbi:MAG: hypothetical protein H7836_15735 [Magnetococcus sp. YQC-3]